MSKLLRLGPVGKRVAPLCVGPESLDEPDWRSYL